MQITQKFITSNNQGNSNTCTPKIIVIHDTGNTSKGAGAMNHYKWINNNNDLGRSAHVFVDSQMALQVIPFDRMSFHTGVKYKDIIERPDCKNHNSIGIEFCVNEDGDLHQTLINLVDVVAQLQRKFNISIDNVITHYMSSGKQCPNTFMRTPSLWSKFKADLMAINTQNKIFQKAIETIHQKGIINSPEYWQKQTNLNIQNLIINMSKYINSEN